MKKSVLIDQFLEIPAVAELSDDVAVVFTFKNIQALDYILVIKLFEDVDFVLEELLSNSGSEGAEFDHFNGDNLAIGSINSTEDLTEVAFAHSITQAVIIVINFFAILSTVFILSVGFQVCVHFEKANACINIYIRAVTYFISSFNSNHMYIVRLLYSDGLHSSS